MQEIFDKIKGREWDWFGYKKNKFIEHATNNFCFIIKIYKPLSEIFWKGTLEELWPSKEDAHYKYYSLADLLANKSWTDACGLTSAQCHTAFTKLRLKGHQNSIDYIKSKML